MRKLILLSIISLTSASAWANQDVNSGQQQAVEFNAAPLVISAESPSDDRFTLPAGANKVLQDKKVSIIELQKNYAKIQAEIQKLTLALTFDGATNIEVSAKINELVGKANSMLVFLEDAEHDFVVEKDVFLAGGQDLAEPLATAE